MEEKLRKIIKTYGFEKQFKKLCEEMTELAYYTDEQNMKEEMADVLVVLYQLIIEKGWGSDIKSIMEYKVNRQLMKIKNLENTK